MKFGQQLRQGTMDRLKLACLQDNSIVVSSKDLGNSEGFPESYLVDLGLTKADLKRLETCGFAKRGYARHKSGHVKRWILVIE